MGEPVPNLFAAILDLACERDGVASINTLPGCWERALGGGWRVSVNGHAEQIKNVHGRDVPPYHALFEHPDYIGALAIVGPGGGIAAGGSEPDILEAIRTAPPVGKDVSGG